MLRTTQWQPVTSIQLSRYRSFAKSSDSHNTETRNAEPVPVAGSILVLVIPDSIDYRGECHVFIVADRIWSGQRCNQQPVVVKPTAELKCEPSMSVNIGACRVA